MRKFLTACSAAAVLGSAALAMSASAAVANEGPHVGHQHTVQTLSARRHYRHRRYYRHYGYTYGRPYYYDYAYEPGPYYYGPRYYYGPPFPFSLWPFW